MTNRTLNEYLTYGAEVENLENWAVLGSLRNGGQGEDGAQVESLGNGAQVESLGRDAIPSTSGVSRDASTTTTTMNESTENHSDDISTSTMDEQEFGTDTVGLSVNDYTFMNNFFC